MKKKKKKAVKRRKKKKEKKKKSFCVSCCYYIQASASAATAAARFFAEMRDFTSRLVRPVHLTIAWRCRVCALWRASGLRMERTIRRTRES
jgi:hypothetical protein